MSDPRDKDIVPGEVDEDNEVPLKQSGEIITTQTPEPPEPPEEKRIHPRRPLPPVPEGPSRD
jgi:hypothetical protein